ncbi:unnamed protein product [Caenorhabditis sp. 36 PRJEB53466]|nr:unnamed protein product [Caenorhabditis sp. 36 PRJEB53466]
MSSPPSKRQDLQGIRGLAILSVLGFHFYPHLFPNGYLGVDQFFVLSGFLMCMLLTKTEKKPPCSVLVHFYSRRFKRILPLYLLILLLTVVALYTVFPDSAVLQNQSSATKALLFVSNRPHTGEEDYFEKLQLAIDLFTHTWSLSVEIQFYFIVPAIFLVGNMLSPAFKYGYYFILGLISLAFYLSLPPEMSFNSTLARIWQFLIGMLIYMCAPSPVHSTASASYKRLESVENGESDAVCLIDKDGFSEEEEEGEAIEERIPSPSPPSTSLGPFSKHCFLLPMAFVITYPIEMFPSLVRPLFTVFTGILMLLSIDDPFLSYRALTYIGDISYSLYLVHWPIYAFVKLTFPDNQFALSASLLTSVLVAVIVFETFEKWYLKLSSTSVGVLILVLFIANMALINKDVIQDALITEKVSTSKYSRLDGVTANMTFDDAIRMNDRWNKYDLEEMIEPGCIKRSPKHTNWCDYEEKGNEFKIAMFGNSYTENHHKMLIQECRHRTYNITTDSERGCEPLAVQPNDKGCAAKLPEFVEFIESAEPDYAFMFTRFFAVGDPFDNNNTDLEKDRTYLEMRSQLNKFIPHIKKKLFILDSFPRANAGYISKVAVDLKQGKSIEEISKKLLVPDGYERGRLRHAALIKECNGKCELIDYLPLFWNNSTKMLQYFDERGFSYFTSPNHLSAHGIELVRPIYTKICANLS